MSEPLVRHPLHVRRAEAVLAGLTALFCVVLVLTNVVGVKLFQLFPEGRPVWFPGNGPLTLTTGILTYPATFFATDIVSEIWGRRRADTMVWLGFFMSLVMLAVVWLAKVVPPSPLWTGEGLAAPEMQAAFEVTYRWPALLLFASMVAYLVAQLFDVRLYHFWWRVTSGRHMWLRNNGSTMVSQLVDTIIVNGIYLHWGLKLAAADIVAVIVASYLVKLVMAACDTPFIYIARGVLRRFLHLDRAAAPLSAPLA